MPPHLHPRSTATSTLFAGTLLASFIVVGIPHVFPCPRPRRGYADSERQIEYDADGKPIAVKRRKRDTPASEAGDTAAKLEGKQIAKSMSQARTLEEEAALFKQLQQEADIVEREARECPVPKPGGMVGRILGFGKTNSKSIEGHG